MVEAYARWLSRNGDKDEALKVFKAFDEVLPRHPLIVEAMDEIKAGKKLPPLVDSPQAGAAEVLYGLGAALGRRGGEDLGLVYLQLALYLAPNHPLALLSLADLYEQVKKPELAIKVYERVPAEFAAAAQRRDPARGQSRRARPHRRGQAAAGEADRRAIRTTSKRSWRSATSCAAARNSPNAPTPTARASPRCQSARSRTG